MKTKIVVNEMPTIDKDCPFAIPPSNDNFPCVCDLKHNNSKGYFSSISFGGHNYYDCKLSEGQCCDMLVSLKEMKEV